MSEAGKAVFLSYASQDKEAARRICDALRAAGLEVWFDVSELRGGDAWDAKIRRQIKECALFVPIISATTNARPEGYFRLEWKLAVDRSHLLADDHPFLFPIAIGDVNEANARVPDKFRDVQWTHLRLDETPAELAARITRLLGGETLEAGRPRPAERGEGTASSKKEKKDARPAWLKYAWSIAGLALACYYLIFNPIMRRLNRPEHPPAKRDAAAAPAPANAWPADPDLKRAMAILNNWEGTPETYALAEDLAKGVLARQPTDTDATIVYALVNTALFNRGFDASDERYALMRRYTERALQLAPDNPKALAAMAQSLTYRNPDFPRAETLIRRAIELAPQEKEFRRILGYNILLPTNPPAAFKVVEENVRLFPDDPLAWYNMALVCRSTGDLDLMEQSLDRCIALAPVGSALIWKGWLAAWRHGDLPAFKTWLDRIPGNFRANDRTVFMSYVYACLSGDTAYGLQAVTGTAGTWMRDYYYIGPRALLLGDLYAREGKSDLAREHYEEALAQITRQQAANPGDYSGRNAQIWTLIGLGRLDEAKKLNQLGLGNLRRPFTPIYMIWWQGAIPAQLLLGERTLALALIREAAATPVVRAQLRVALRIDPRMAPFRDDPEITALLAEPDANALSLPPTVDPKSVAVLAFTNLSDDKANEYFSDGISEELLTVLQKIPGLKVSARTSAFSFKGRDVSVQEIGKTLGVAHLVDGSVRKAGGKVRITARLSRTDTGQQLWSESYTRDVDDVFKLQTELAQTIVAQLKEQLTGGKDVDKDDVANQVTAAQKGGTTNVAAHELYLQGRYFANQPSMANLGKAVDFLQRAVDLDPTFALAWAALARNLAVQAEYLDTTPETLREAFARARRAADRAVALAPKLPDGYFARNEIQSAYDYDWQGARESLNLALSLAPTDALLVSNASQLAAQFGDVPRSLELGRRAVELDPVNAEIRYWLGRIYLSAGLLAEGEAELRRAADLSPSLLSVHRQIATALVLQNRAAAAVEEARLEKEEWSRQAALAVSCWAAKDVPGANAALARLIEVASESAAFQIAEAYAVRGESDKAFEWLDRAYRNRDSGFGQLRMDPLLKSLHADPRWAPLLQQAGLADDRVK